MNVTGVYVGDSLNISVEKTMVLLEGMKLILNDRGGIKSVLQFIGVQFSGGTHHKCRIQNIHGTTYFVGPETLHFLENLDIASVPQTLDDYCRECESVLKNGLNHILKPQSRSPLQEETTSYRIKLYPLSFLKLTEQAERGEFT